MQNQKVQIWLPVGFAALLSGMKMFIPGDSGSPAFYSFLPMCFFFVALTQMSLVKKIEMLEADGSRSPED